MSDYQQSGLLPQEKYLEAGAHIGTRNKHGGMKEYIYKARNDGLHVIDLKKLDERLLETAQLLAKQDAGKTFIISSKDNAKKPIQKFCEMTGFQSITGRFTPGRFTNPARNDFVEPEMIMVCDPSVDKQAIKEASTFGVPVIGLCDTNNNPAGLSLVIPTNNKGRKALGLVFWVLTREVLKAQGKITSDEEYSLKQEDFEA
ncbi:30S ribosomal protein S2 [Candidatus Micrarchaeota archaeon]|nr:30S ribosomal protein S2 [Candidatus Micrarchaeota archaeon]